MIMFLYEGGNTYNQLLTQTNNTFSSSHLLPNPIWSTFPPDPPGIPSHILPALLDALIDTRSTSSTIDILDIVGRGDTGQEGECGGCTGAVEDEVGIAVGRDGGHGESDRKRL